MPTYEYQCEACGHAFEKMQPMSAAPIRKCPECGKSKVKRLISAGAGLIFKGSGFYITDYRDAGYKESAKADTPASTKSESKSDAPKSDAPKTESTKSDSTAPAKTESKPAPKSDSKPSKKK